MSRMRDSKRMSMMIPAARNSMVPAVSVPSMRKLTVRLYTSQDGDTVSVLESSVASVRGNSNKTVRPGRKAV